MKTFSTVLIFSFVLSQSLWASSFGKFKMTLDADYRDQQSVVFLMNSQSEITIIEDDYYYEISSAPFFGEVALNFQSGGDEDYITALFVIRDNKLIQGCAAFIDAKNEAYHPYWNRSVDFSRWNKITRKYESLITDETLVKNEDCINELTQNYSGFDRY